MKKLTRWANVYQGGKYMTAWNSRAMADAGCDITKRENFRVKFKGQRQACVEFIVLWEEDDGLYDEEREKALHRPPNPRDDSVPDLGLDTISP